MRSLSNDLISKKFFKQVTKLSEKVTKETSQSSHRPLYKSIIKPDADFRLNRKLDSLKFENDLKALRLEKLKSQIGSLETLKSSCREQETIIRSLENTKTKFEDLLFETQSLTYKKTQISNKRLCWKRMLDELSEIFEKFSSQHKSSLFVREKAVKDSKIVTKKLTSFRESLEKERDDQKNKISSKQQIKKNLEQSSKRILENISKLDSKKKLKKEKISDLFEKLSKNLNNIELKETQMQNELILNEITSAQQLASTLNIVPTNLPKLTNKLLKKYHILLKNLKFNSETFQALSETVNTQKRLCNSLKSETLNLKSSQAHLFPNLPSTNSSKPNNSEPLLLSLYATFHTISLSLLSKLTSIYSQSKDPQLYVFIHQFPRPSHSPMPRSTSIIQVPQRRKEKTFTLNPNFSTKALPNLNSNSLSELARLIKEYFHCFKDSHTVQSWLLKNKIIQMFLHTGDKIDQDLKESFVCQEEIAKFLYCQAQEMLRINLKGLINRLVPAVLYVKSYVPKGFSGERMEDVQIGNRAIRRLENRFVVKGMSRGGRRKKSSPRGSYTFRGKVTSESQSPEGLACTRVESLKAFRKNDEKLRALTTKFKLY